jgi:hypothetical protein
MLMRSSTMSYLRSKQATSLLAGAASLALCALLSGCGTASVATNTSGIAHSVQLKGTVHGGQWPVAGANIQFYAAGSNGYGVGSTYLVGTSLLGTTVVTTGADGSFSITGDYVCPSPTTLVYLVATGGNPGLPQGTNPNIGLMATLGQCGQLSNSTFVSINELTTVASVWALSPFMNSVSNIGSSASNAQGLLNAFAAVNKLVNTATGVVSGPALPAGATLPVAKINTLADILASCINTAGGIAGDGSACGILFSNTAVNGTAPTDTITAAMNMAQHPNNQVSALVGMTTPAAPFQPTLASTPNDLQLVISYSAGGFSSPRGVAVDASGYVWVPNAAGNTLTQLDNSGVPLSGTSGYSAGTLNQPSAVAIDLSGNAWVANKGNNSVSEINPSGTAGTIYSGGGLNTPTSIAIDAYGNAWTANNGNSSVTEIAPSGTITTYTPAGVSTPVGIAIDPK